MKKKVNYNTQFKTFQHVTTIDILLGRINNNFGSQRITLLNLNKLRILTF